MKEAGMSNEIQAYENKARVFAEEAFCYIAEGSICGDGGYTETVETTNGETISIEGATSMLGADMSPIMVAIVDHQQRGIEYTPEDLTERGIQAGIKRFGRFDFHTSHHEHHEHKATDCGHLLRMTKPDLAPKYQINPEDALAAIAYAKTKSKSDPRVVEQNLDRNHAEGQVFVNVGVETTFIHWLKPEVHSSVADLFPESGDIGVMNFVVDEKRAAERHEQIWLGMGYTAADFDRLHAIRKVQASATNGGLAAGKPVFLMNWDDPSNRETKYLGIMQPDGSIK